jgi:hypothetical protein
VLPPSGDGSYLVLAGIYFSPLNNYEYHNPVGVDNAEQVRMLFPSITLALPRDSLTAFLMPNCLRRASSSARSASNSR